MPEMRIVRILPGDEQLVLDAAALFDASPDRATTSKFLAEPGHHLLLAFVDATVAGFVTGVETTHPDKGTEMFLYELAVDEAFRRQGIGKALVTALADIAIESGCYGMWVGTDHDNVAALATYVSTGAEPPEPSVTLTWRFDGDRHP
jgi:[ribosomal protein S18]-alanine N-acetyltransferase